MNITTNVAFTPDSTYPSPLTTTGSLNSSAFSERRALITPCNVDRQSLSQGSSKNTLQAHRSRLPLTLYLLSFAPPFGREVNNDTQKSSWSEVLAHPYILYTLGALSAIPAGLAFPAQDLLYGYWTTGVTATDATPNEIIARGSQTGWIMAVAGIMILFLAWAFLACFSAASHALTERLRQAYVASVIAQDAAFFEKIGPGEISTRVSKDITAIRIAFGEKLGYLVWSLSTIIASIVPSLVNSPKLAGVLFGVIPFVLAIFGFLGWANDVLGGPVNDLEGRASSLVEQVLSSVRIVQSFSMSSSLIERFDRDLLKRLRTLGAKRSVIRSLEQSSVYFALFLTYSLAFWFGGIQVREGLDTGHVLTAFFNYANILSALASIVPHISCVADAMVSLREIRRQIERQPFIDIRDESGIKLPEVGWKPSFALEHVTFAYPSRPNIPALRDVSVKIQTGTMTAFVGPSGSGKSTAASLLLREYDPETANIPNPSDLKSTARAPADGNEDLSQSGKGLRQSLDLEKGTKPAGGEELVMKGGVVYFAGRDVREYNLRWLRSQVAVVSQNPQLFSATIFENVAAGLTGTDLEYQPDIDGADDAPQDIKQRTAKIKQLCFEALQKAQAWQFVSKLPKGMDTMIAGGRTGVLSGGQRQRLAIARALVRKPTCLLLDEATSALDADTEEKIRVMLEQEMAERDMTVIVVAHRLNTVAKAGRIIVMKDGRIVDQGRYEELMDPHRLDQTFRQMAIAQRADSFVADSVSPLIPRSNLWFQTDRQQAGIDRKDQSNDLEDTDSRVTSLTDDLNIKRVPATKVTKEASSGSPHLLLKLVASQKWLYLVGILGGLLTGVSYPLAGWMTGGAVESLSDIHAKPGINTWAFWFLILAVCNLLICFINAFYFEAASDNIARAIKRESLRALIKQEIGFFEQQDASSGGLTSAVSSYPANIRAATGLVSAQVLIAGTNVVGSICMGAIVDWKIALVCLPFITILLFSGWLNVAMLERYEDVTSVPAAKAASYVNETVDYIKTVAALGREEEAMRVLNVQARTAPKRRKYLVMGCGGFAVGQGMILLMTALVFYWASKRLAEGASIEEVFAVFEAVIIAAFSGSRLFTFVGDYGRAVSSFKAILLWLRREPRHLIFSGACSKGELGKDWASGDIVFDRVELRYPQRPDNPTLTDLSLRIGAGQTHAFCGTSGSGKSSILALLQRFYDPSGGSISFGGVDHRQLSLEDIRASMGYVSQDPVLFEGTVRWNLSLGSLDPASVTEDQIKRACEGAYIWDFVCKLEKGLDTEIGMKGASLSGGQRQRLCIARALIRDPKILLLDEATSALDAQSEKSVQMALDNARKGRTTITIAHRLSTIRRSDVIHVIEDGQVKETGSHEVLLDKRGRYFELVQAEL